MCLAQELNCKVIINDEQIQTTERDVFRDMEQAFAEFMNNRKWTEDEFLNHERINCNLLITLDPSESKPGLAVWGASVQILSSRPVFNTDYESVVLNFADRDWIFEYKLSQPLQFSEVSFTSNITSLLAYYAYTILGLDYDTFSELGGTRFYQVANQIVLNAQNANYVGWGQFNSVRNRYWLNENLLSSNFEPLRKALYKYHLGGLDLFQSQADSARQNIFESLQTVQQVNATRPRSIITISFLDAKSEELTSIMKGGTPLQKRQSYEILSKLEPSKADIYRKILE